MNNSAITVKRKKKKRLQTGLVKRSVVGLAQAGDDTNRRRRDLGGYAAQRDRRRGAPAEEQDPRGLRRLHQTVWLVTVRRFILSIL